MNKASLKKIVSAVVVAATITTLSPLGVSAQWRQNADSTWNYAEGNTIVQGWKNISDIWYYFNSNGKMNTGWISDNGIWYYNNNSGEMEKETGEFAKMKGEWDLTIIEMSNFLSEHHFPSFCLGLKFPL